MKKSVIAMAAAVTMIATLFAPSASFAQTKKAQLDGQLIYGVTQKELDEDSVMGSAAKEQMADEGIAAYRQSAASSKAWSKTSNATFYNGNGTKILKGAVAKGIDVSYHQGNIDWKKVSKTDVDYVIIRLGYGGDIVNQDDKKLTENVEGCEKYGIPYGFYLYSYCKSDAKNASEIAHTLRLLKGTKPEYPVYYDLEDEKTTGKCSNSNIAKWAVNYCNAIKKAGYTPGIYAAYNWWNNKLTSSSLDEYEKWVARYNNEITTSGYKKAHSMWQVASDYHVNGIGNSLSRVDLNFAYKKFGSASKPPVTDETTTKPTQSPSTENSTVDQVMQPSASTSAAPSGTVVPTEPEPSDKENVTGFVERSGKRYYYQDGALIKGKWFTVGKSKYYATTDGSICQSTYRKIGSYYYGFDSKGVMYASKTAKIGSKKYYFYKDGHAYLCKVKTKVRLNYRTSASTKGKIAGTYSKGKTLAIVRKSGNWYMTNTGYWVHKTYLKVTKKYPY